MFLIHPGAALYDAHTNRTWNYAEICSAAESFSDSLQSPAKCLLFLFCRNNAPCVFAYLGAIEAWPGRPHCWMRPWRRNLEHAWIDLLPT